MRNFWQRMERMLICTILSRTLSEKILKMAKEALQNLCGNTLSGAFHRKHTENPPGAAVCSCLIF